LAQESASIIVSCEAFVRSIHEDRYYDAHEDLESLWHPRRFEDDDEVRLWKGFINAAVSFELMKRGRSMPSETAWQTYLKYSHVLENLATPRKELYVKMIQIIESKRASNV
jgi:hypothetical protein